MFEYKYLYPSSMLAPFVKNYWFLRTFSSEPAKQRVIPYGTINIMIHRGGLPYDIFNGCNQSRSFICGQTTSYSDLTVEGITDMVCITFTPHGARAFVPFPVNELKNISVPLYSSGIQWLVDLEKRIQEAHDGLSLKKIIDECLSNHIREDAFPNHNRMSYAVNLIESGQADVSRIAKHTCLSNKQFNRIFSSYVGTNPKEFICIVRYQKALALMQAGTRDLTSVSLDSGYYDQSHMDRDFKKFTGFTPSGYLKTSCPYSDYFDNL